MTSVITSSFILWIAVTTANTCTTPTHSHAQMTYIYCLFCSVRLWQHLFDWTHCCNGHRAHAVDECYLWKKQKVKCWVKRRSKRGGENRRWAEMLKFSGCRRILYMEMLLLCQGHFAISEREVMQYQKHAKETLQQCHCSGKNVMVTNWNFFSWKMFNIVQSTRYKKSNRYFTCLKMFMCHGRSNTHINVGWNPWQNKVAYVQRAHTVLCVMCYSAYR